MEFKTGIFSMDDVALADIRVFIAEHYSDDMEVLATTMMIALMKFAEVMAKENDDERYDNYVRFTQTDGFNLWLHLAGTDEHEFYDEVNRMMMKDIHRLLIKSIK